MKYQLLHTGKIWPTELNFDILPSLNNYFGRDDADIIKDLDTCEIDPETGTAILRIENINRGNTTMSFLVVSRSATGIVLSLID